MKQFTRFSIILGMSLMLSPLYAAPAAFEATYTVSTKGLNIGETNVQLSYQGSQYTYQKNTKANGVAALLSGDTLTERSTGQTSDKNLSPQQYTQQHKSKRKNKRDSFEFTNATQISGTYNDTPYQLAVPAGTLDAAVMELYLMDDLATGKPLQYQVASKGKLQAYHFRRLGTETIEVPAGKYTCEKVEVAHQDRDQQTTLWLAPELHYGIVQVQHRENGDLIETQLNRYQQH